MMQTTVVMQFSKTSFNVSRPIQQSNAFAMGKKVFFSPVFMTNFASKNTYVPPKNEEERQKRFEKLKKKNPNIQEYSYIDWRRAITTRKITKQTNIENVIKLFDSLSEKGATPNSIIFNAIFSKCYVLGETETAKNYFEKLEEMKIEPDIETYSYLIGFHTATGQKDKALEYKSALEASNIQKNLAYYHNLIRSCKLSVDVKLALEYFEELKAQGLVPTIKTYQHLLLVCKKANGKSANIAKKLFNEAVKLKIVDTLLCATYLSCIHDIETLDEELRAVMKLPSGHNVEVMNTCLKYLSTIPNVDKAEEYFNFMVDSKIVPDQYTFFHLMNTCYNDNNIIRGDQFYRQMVFEFKITSFLVNAVHRRVHDDIQEGRRTFVASDIPYAHTF